MLAKMYANLFLSVKKDVIYRLYINYAFNSLHIKNHFVKVQNILCVYKLMHI